MEIQQEDSLETIDKATYFRGAAYHILPQLNLYRVKSIFNVHHLKTMNFDLVYCIYLELPNGKKFIWRNKKLDNLFLRDEYFPEIIQTLRDVELQ
jgi:hypothetical protein